MLQQTQAVPLLETGGDLNIPNQQELRVYSRKQNSQGNKLLMNSMHCPESELVLGTNSSSSGNPENIFETLDVPITHRKGVRSCTKHPISKSVSYDNLSPSFHAFTTNLSSVNTPRSVKEAFAVPEWKNAALEEMQALKKNDTWSLVKLPQGKSVIRCKWIFTVKLKPDGLIERYKARLVAKGFTQTYGVDYTETFAPVAKLNTIRVLLSLVVHLDQPLFQLYVKNAFLNGELEEEVYMSLPLGFEEDKKNRMVCKLKKSPYGLKQSPRAWFDIFLKVIRSHGYSQGQTDHTLFVKHSSDGKITPLIVYIDGIILTRGNFKEMEEIKRLMAMEFEVKDLGTLKSFLGMEVARSKKGISISQRKYTLDLLEETGMLDCKPIKTPIEQEGKAKLIEGDMVDKGRYQWLVGKLIYLSHTKPDITFAVSVVSQYMHSSCQGHFHLVYQILRYLKKTLGKGLFFGKEGNRKVEIFTDADWAGSINDRKSTSGYCTRLWGNLVTWHNKKKSVVARSSTEADYKAMTYGICEAIWLKQLLEELRISL